MTNPTTPPENNDAVQRARQAAGLKVVVVMLLIFAIIVGFFLTVLPMPVRIIVACVDVIAAIVLAMIIRQKFSAR